MTLQSYNQRLKKETLDVYKKHFGHLNVTKAQRRNDPRGSEAPTGRFASSNLLNTHFPTSKKPKNAPIQTEEDFIEQCLAEYTQWVAQTEKRLDKLRLPPLLNTYRPTDFSSLHDKEATH